MSTIQIQVENTFIKSQLTNSDVGATVYERVFRKLSIERGPLGKIHPIYLKIGPVYKIFGVLTMNKGGSFSFFPELPGDYKFDHITFSENLLKGNHHYTRPTWIGREKVLPLHAQLLSNGTYHALTFLYRDHQLLIDVPRIINYPEMPNEYIPELNTAFFTSGKPEGSTHIKFNNTQNPICIQFFFVPSEVGHKALAPFNVDLLSDTQIQYHLIPHEYQNKYALGIVAFSYPVSINEPLTIFFFTQRQGFYTKIDMIHNKKKH